MLPNDPADAQERRRALDVDRSFLVRAPAGSGKTELLIQRYLALLARVEAPEAIVAITFTRKAAAEMSDRVLKALREAKPGVAEAALDRDRRLGWNLLNNPSRMAIQTIDSLCTNIAGRMPWIARLGDMPDIAENAGALYAEAARETLRMVAGDRPEGKAVATLLSHLDNRAENVAQLIAAMLGRREQWMEEIFELKEDPARAREYLEESLRLHVEKALQRRGAFVPRTPEGRGGEARPSGGVSIGPIERLAALAKSCHDDPVDLGFQMAPAADRARWFSAGTAEDPTPRSDRRASRK